MKVFVRTSVKEKRREKEKKMYFSFPSSRMTERTLVEIYRGCLFKVSFLFPFSFFPQMLYCPPGAFTVLFMEQTLRHRRRSHSSIIELSSGSELASPSFSLSPSLLFRALVSSYSAHFLSETFSFLNCFILLDASTKSYNNIKEKRERKRNKSFWDYLFLIFILIDFQVTIHDTFQWMTHFQERERRVVTSREEIRIPRSLYTLAYTYYTRDLGLLQTLMEQMLRDRIPYIDYDRIKTK